MNNLKNFKLKTYGIKEISEIIQDVAFELGYSWNQDKNYLNNDTIQQIFLYENGTMTYLSSHYEEYFNIHMNKEITFEELIDIYLESLC